MESLYCLPAILAPRRPLRASPEPRYHGETHEEGFPRAEDRRDPAGTEVEGRDGAEGEVRHERREGRPSDRRHVRGRPVRPGCRRERLRRPRRRDRRPDGGPPSAFGDSSREGRTRSADAHLLHGGDVRALHRPGGAHGGDLSSGLDEIDLPQLRVRGDRECRQDLARHDEAGVARLVQDRIPRTHAPRHQPHGEGQTVPRGIRSARPGGDPRGLRIPVPRPARTAARRMREGARRGNRASDQPTGGRGPRRRDPRGAGPGRRRDDRPAQGVLSAPPQAVRRPRHRPRDDEVQAGMGRTGRLWAIENWNTVPDILVSGKAVGGGLPFGGVTGKPAVMDRPGPGSLGGTFGGNPVVCAAALEAIDEIQKALPKTKRLESLIRKRLDEIFEGHERVGEVRGIGAMWALEFVKHRETKEPDVELARAVQLAGLKNGLLLLTAGFFNNCIRLLPPINIPLPLMAKALDLLEDSLDLALAGKAS